MNIVKKDSLIYKLLILFYTFFKIGLFTFGGGYAMIPLINDEVVDKKKWITSIEMMDMIAISESTPGPISVNTATFVGYKVAGIWGAIYATLGLAVPSFIIIIIISILYNQFINNIVIQNMFKGIRVGVIVILCFAIVKLSKLMPKNKISIIVFILMLITSLVLTFTNVVIPSISIILIGVGLVIGLVTTLLSKKEIKK